MKSSGNYNIRGMPSISCAICCGASGDKRWICSGTIGYPGQKKSRERGLRIPGSNSTLSPSIHKFDDELIPSGLSAEGASGVEFTDLNT